MAMRKVGAPADNNVHGVVTSNVDEKNEPLVKKADEPKKDKNED
jgi:hypothetical protein